MKSLVVVLFVLAVAMFFVGCSSESVMYNADMKKAPGEVRDYLEISQARVEGLEVSISALKAENMAITEKMNKYSFDTVQYLRAQAELAQNDSLISAYEGNVLSLQSDMTTFLVSSANRTQEHETRIVSRNASAVADAYVQINNADLGIRTSGSGSVSDSSSEVAIGLLRNQWSHAVIAQVSGPDGYYREFNLPPYSKHAFSFPPSGKETKEYTTTFVSAYGSSQVAKSVSANSLFVDDDGRCYKYMATQFGYRQ